MAIVLQAQADKADINFLFSSIQEHNLQISSNTSDNWSEDNTVINDCIALNPLEITLTGFIGEIVYKSPSKAERYLYNKFIDSGNKFLKPTLINKLSAITTILPRVDNYTQLAKNVVKTGENIYNRFKSAYDKWNKKEGIISEQEKNVQELINLWKAKIPLYVKTPWGWFDDMYIVNAPIQQGNTISTTNITVTLKQLNIVQKLNTVSNQIKSEINETQTSEEQNTGIATGITNKVAFNDLIKNTFG